MRPRPLWAISGGPLVDQQIQLTVVRLWRTAHSACRAWWRAAECASDTGIWVLAGISQDMLVIERSRFAGGSHGTLVRNRICKYGTTAEQLKVCRCNRKQRRSCFLVRNSHRITRTIWWDLCVLSFHGFSLLPTKGGNQQERLLFYRRGEGSVNFNCFLYEQLKWQTKQNTILGLYTGRLEKSH